MSRATFTLMIAMALTACGGTSNHTISADGEPFGSGTCQGNECAFDCELGAPALDGRTTQGDVEGVVRIDASAAEHLLNGDATHALRVDGLEAPDVYLTPDGTAWRDGHPVGVVEFEDGNRARLLNTSGEAWRALLGHDAVHLG